MSNSINKSVTINGHGLDIWAVESVARHCAAAEISKEARVDIRRCEELVRNIAESGAAVYGVTTGIGEFARIRIDPAQGEELQRRIIFSHAAGTGDTQPIPVVRA